jgi:UDP-N-acetylglucosamine acyltransferase
MATLLIHPTAVIHSAAELHPTVQVGAYAVIGPKVKVGAGTVIAPHVVLDGDTHIGERNQLFPGAAIGLEPQDLKYDGSVGPVRIGNGNQIREYVTIHRPTRGDEITRLGDNNLLMAYTHVGHNCVIEDQVIIANSVAMAGHVHVESGARISGVLGVHQFVRIGRLSMVGGMTRIDRDVPPFMMVEGNPPRVRSINTVGLQRAGLDPLDLKVLKQAFKLLYRSESTFAESLEKLEHTQDNLYVQHLSNFIRRSQLPGRRGLISGRG